jgi:DNA-directed RNA polymerase subunit K/omega
MSDDEQFESDHDEVSDQEPEEVAEEELEEKEEVEVEEKNIEEETESESEDEKDDDKDDEVEYNSDEDVLNEDTCYQKHTPTRGKRVELIKETKKLINDPRKQNGHKIVDKKDRITGNYLTKYDAIRIVSTRAAQLQNGAPALIEVPKDINYVELAILELKHGKTPFKLIRRLPNNEVEVFELSEMKVPDNVF